MTRNKLNKSDLLSPAGLTIEWPLWSLQVLEAGEGGGGMSGLKVEELADDVIVPLPPVTSVLAADDSLLPP